MMIIIAIANAILWSGVIMALLLIFMRREKTLESRLVVLESKGEDAGQEF